MKEILKTRIWLDRIFPNTLRGLLLLVSIFFTVPVYAEYADVVINNYSDKEGVRPVIFPHWFHRIRYQCRVCHSELKFEMRVGATQPTMEEITSGAFCGACHDGEIAWSVENCGLCHSALPGTPAGISGSHETLGPGVW